MRKKDFKVGTKFRTSTGEWLVIQVDDLNVMAKPLWRWANGFDKEYLPEDFPSIPFNRKHWPSCITIEEWKQLISKKRHKQSRIPCYRCYNNDRSVSSTLLEICSPEMVNGQKILRGTTVLVCAHCKKSDERSCITFGKYKWICQCGANIWWDDPKTDEKCENCGRDRTFGLS